MFSADDDLPKGSLTVSFKFRLFARRLVTGLNSIAIRSANLLYFGTTTAGNTVYFDLFNEGIDLPAPGGYASGWHQVTVSFDSTAGVLQAYFDGQLGVNRTGFKRGKTLAATLGPGACGIVCACIRDWVQGLHGSVDRLYCGFKERSTTIAYDPWHGDPMSPKQVASSRLWFRRMPLWTPS
jgi:hypothetical protein